MLLNALIRFNLTLQLFTYTNNRSIQLLSPNVLPDGIVSMHPTNGSSKVDEMQGIGDRSFSDYAFAGA